MARRFPILVAVALGLSAVPFAPSTALADHDTHVTLEQVPPAARQVIQNEIADGTLRDIELEHENGQTVYEAEITTKAGGELEVQVTPEGKIVKRTQKHPH